MRRVAIIWLIASAIIAAVTTILQVEPALTFIHIFASSDGSFIIIIPLGLSFLLFVLPLLLIMVMRNFIYNSRNKFPIDLSDKTGIIVDRQRELSNAALLYNVYIKNEEQGRVGMGKKVFIELDPGEYTVQLRLGKKMYSNELHFSIQPLEIIKFHTGYNLNKNIQKMMVKGEMLFLVRL